MKKPVVITSLSIRFYKHDGWDLKTLSKYSKGDFTFKDCLLAGYYIPDVGTKIDFKNLLNNEISTVLGKDSYGETKGRSDLEALETRQWCNQEVKDYMLKMAEKYYKKLKELIMTSAHEMGFQQGHHIGMLEGRIQSLDKVRNLVGEHDLGDGEFILDSINLSIELAREELALALKEGVK